MMLKEELIKKYLHGELNPDETKELERLRLSDEDFANELEIQSVYYAERSANLKAELLNHTNNITKKSKLGLLPILFLVLGLAAAGYCIKSFISNNKSKSHVYIADNYLADRHAAPPVLMGNQTDDELWTNSIALYNKATFNESAVSFTEAIKIEGKKDQAMLYAGLSHLYSNPPNYDGAITLFNKLIDNNSLYTEEAKWYLALSYMKTSDTDKSEKLFQDIMESNSWNHMKAKELINTKD